MSKEEGSSNGDALFPLLWTAGWYNATRTTFWPDLPGPEGYPIRLTQAQHDMIMESYSQRNVPSASLGTDLQIVYNTTHKPNVESFPPAIFVYPIPLSPMFHQQHQMQQVQPSGAVPQQLVQPPMPYRIHQMRQMQYIPPYGATPQQIVQSMPIYYHQHQMQQFQSPGQLLKHQETQTDLKECKEQETQTGSTENKTLPSTDSVGHDHYSTQVRNGSEQNEWVSSKQQPFTSSQTLEKLSVPAERKEKRLEYKPSHAQKTDEVSTECGQSDTDPHNKGAIKEQKQHPTTPTQLVSETEGGIVAEAPFQFPKKPAKTSEISLAQKSVERQKVLTTQPKTLEKSKVESVVGSETTTSEKEPSAASSSNQDSEKAAEKTVSQKKKPNEKKKFKKKAPKGTKAEKSGHADDDFEIPNYEKEWEDIYKVSCSKVTKCFATLFRWRQSFFAFQKDEENLTTYEQKCRDFWKDRSTLCIPHLRNEFRVDDWLSERITALEERDTYPDRKMAILYKAVSESQSEAATEDIIFIKSKTENVDLEAIEKEYYQFVMNVPSVLTDKLPSPIPVISFLASINVPGQTVEMADNFRNSINIQYRLRNNLKLDTVKDLDNVDKSATDFTKAYKRAKNEAIDWTPERTKEFLTERLNYFSSLAQTKTIKRFVVLYKFLLGIKSDIIDFNSYWLHQCQTSLEPIDSEEFVTEEMFLNNFFRDK